MLVTFLFGSIIAFVLTLIMSIINGDVEKDHISSNLMFAGVISVLSWAGVVYVIVKIIRFYKSKFKK